MKKKTQKDAKSNEQSNACLEAPCFQVRGEGRKVPPSGRSQAGAMLDSQRGNFQLINVVG